MNVDTPRIVNDGNDVEKPEDEPALVQRFGTPLEKNCRLLPRGSYVLLDIRGHIDLMQLELRRNWIVELIIGERHFQLIRARTDTEFWR